VVEVKGNRVMVRPAKPQEVQQAAKERRPPEDLLSRPIEEFGIESFEDDPLG
jgi:hypothetical protein